MRPGRRRSRGGAALRATVAWPSAPSWAGLSRGRSLPWHHSRARVRGRATGLTVKSVRSPAIRTAQHVRARIFEPFSLQPVPIAEPGASRLVALVASRVGSSGHPRRGAGHRRGHIPGGHKASPSLIAPSPLVGAHNEKGRAAARLAPLSATLPPATPSAARGSPPAPAPASDTT